MPYQVIFARSARRALRSLDPSLRRRLIEAAETLGDEPRPPGSLLLTGVVPRTYRVRVGTYRIIYRVDDRAETVDVRDIGHRRDVYRSLER